MKSNLLTLNEETISRESMLAIPAVETSDPAALAPIPMVSVLMITYNHEPYLAEAIEGVIRQSCPFPFELLIGEDCSTDGTRAICLDYQRRYPHIIRVITSERNVGMIRNHLRLRAHARGKYVAYCEGDDYWTDPAKLARQVSFMESHPDCPLCFARFQIVRQLPGGVCEPAGIGGPDGPSRDYDVDGIFRHSVYVHLCTLLERAGAIELPVWFLNTLSSDQVSILLHADQGSLHFSPEITSVYRMHSGGVWNGTAEEHRVRRGIETNRRLARHFAGRYAFWLDRALTQLALTRARILARRGRRKAAWMALRQAWDAASRKRWLINREFFKFLLAFFGSPVYTAAETCVRRLRRLHLRHELAK